MLLVIICGRVYSHPDRRWRGAFPPPAFNRDEFANVAGQANIQDGNSSAG